MIRMRIKKLVGLSVSYILLHYIFLPISLAISTLISFIFILFLIYLYSCILFTFILFLFSLPNSALEKVRNECGWLWPQLASFFLITVLDLTLPIIKSASHIQLGNCWMVKIAKVDEDNKRCHKLRIKFKIKKIR